jgi:hypothetical protein
LGLLQFPLGRTATTVFGREEAGTILAEDFLFFVAEVALGTLVPSGHTPMGIHHKDSVVLCGLHQAPEAFLALFERLLQAAFPGPIVRRTLHAASLPHANSASMDYSANLVEEVFSEVRMQNLA